MTINFFIAEQLEIYAEYGTISGTYANSSPTVLCAPGAPVEFILDNLEPHTRYFYRIRYKGPVNSEYSAGKEYTFITQRAPGDSFTFTITADSHLGTAKHCDPDLYRLTLNNARADSPDFHLDLGDTFRATKLKTVNYNEIAKLYTNHREYFDILCHSSPLFLVIGNHEGELGWMRDGTPDNMAVWAAQARTLYYPNPAPNEFYSGNTNSEPFVGLRENYYAWEWGDALFVALDPWWNSTTDDSVDLEHGPYNLWEFTIGNAQYEWLAQTLKASTAKYKFIFSHHVIGSCRGAVKWADKFEWGGQDQKGNWVLDDYRPSWEQPIHQLFVENNVTIFFQGHDHIFVRQEKDGVIYQTCPMPGDPTYSAYNAEHFHSGDKVPNSGHVRVTVSPKDINVSYIRAFLSSDEIDGHRNGETAFSYSLSKQTTRTFETPPPVLSTFKLEQNNPNPFNPNTHIAFTLPQNEHVRLVIYDVLGKKVRSLIDESRPQGEHSVLWDGRDSCGSHVPSGVYVYELVSAQGRLTGKAAVMR